ncbi:hypothetical protein AVEN_175186-2 [Araneus ventricosus]|uniref:ATP-dependent DNA helicase n=1 Tax=Araneus ventricosus TaxID=182803 RepID=A0A4Y2HH31_ARAVE|nr:hypothetical protein AVEN_175186-2 [Araneus ventricosus]
MAFIENGYLDLRRYNQPTFRTEIAAIFVGDNGEPPANRDISIYPVDDIMKRNLFGRVISYIYVIEFQKRGLPHAHNLLTLDTYSTIRTKDDIDKHVSVELPDPIADPTLFQIITRCMIHGPCGTLNTNSPCMREGVCTKQYSKEFREKTEENINGYPMYQSMCTESVRVGRHYLDNRWVAPYNPWFSKNFNAHINVELRLFFATIYGFGEVNDIPEPWFRYKDALSEYFIRQYHEDSGPKYALAEIEEFLKYYNLNIKKLKLPTVHLPDALSNLPSFDILEEQQKGQINARKLNEGQKLVFDIILEAIYDNNEDTSRLFFLDGPAGTGKTFLYDTLLHTISGKGHHVTPVASRGIAATLLNGGRTAHSVFKIPIVFNATSTCNVEPNA